MLHRLGDEPVVMLLSAAPGPTLTVAAAAEQQAVPLAPAGDHATARHWAAQPGSSVRSATSGGGRPWT